jgi:putative ABC transport system permease protein
VTARPPGWVERALEWWLPPAAGEFIIGDLAEQFEVDLERGRVTATIRYLIEALAATWHVRGPKPSQRQRSRTGDSRMARIFYDLAKAAKTLRRSPGYAFATVAIASVGLAATTAIFSVANPILLRPVPYPAPDQLAIVWEKDVDGSSRRMGYATFVDLSRDATTLQSAAVEGGWLPTISGGDGDPERLHGQRVSWQFFNVLGVAPALGRSFLEADDDPDAPRVVVLTYGLWQRRFGGDPSIVGRTVTIGETPMEVIGVLPATYDDVFDPGTQIYRILAYDVSASYACRTCRHLRMVARIKHDVSRDAATAEMNGLSARLVADHPTEYPAAGLNLVDVEEEVTREVRPALLSVLAAAVLLLVIACANVTSLRLARLTRRREEFAVRRALGAGRAEFARQLLSEGLLVALPAGAISLALAWAAMHALVAQLPTSVPRVSAVHLDGAAFAVAAFLTLGLGVLVGLGPLATVGGRQPFHAMRSAARLTRTGRHGGQAGMIVAEVALALMLLVGTGLLARTLLILLSVNPGFDPDNLLTMEFQSSGARYPDDAAVWNHHDRVHEAVAAVPGVVSAAVTTQLPLGGNFDGFGVHALDKPLPNPELAPGAQRYAVSAGYLAAMGIPLLEGRAFTSSEAADSVPKVAVVSASLAHRIWGDESAIGKQIQVGGSGWRTVIGVAGDVRHTGLETSDLHGYYVPERQWPWSQSAVLVVRTVADPASMVASVRQAVRSVDPAQLIVDVRTGQELIATSTGRQRVTLTVFAIFGIVATFLSAAGVYGVLAGAVAARRREIGIRAALGATPRAIVNLVLRQGLALAGSGLVLGLIGALALTRYMRAMLYGIEPTDPLTVSATVGLLALVALGACLVPAWRALSVDPVTTLREQ